MTTRDRFIDSLGSIDEDLLIKHIEKKYPTRAQKIRRYTAAAAIYAAACLVVIITLPFIIGRGEDPAPKPGNDPIKTETNVPMPDDPEVKKIDAANINEVYNGVDPDSLSDKVTLEEVKAIITAARQAYEDYDVIVLSDGTEIMTTPKKPDHTLEQIKTMSDSDRDNALSAYSEYFNNMISVIEEMFEERFPGKSIYDQKHENDPCIYMMDLEVTGYTTAEEFFTDYYRSDTPYTEWIFINIDKTQTVYYLSSTAEEHEMLYPTTEEYKIWEIVSAWREEQMPKAVAEFDGLRYTISLDKASYSLDDRIAARVYIENVGDESVSLWQPVLSHYIYDVRFYEDGVEKPEFYDEQRDYPEAEESRLLSPGQAIAYYKFFTPGTPSIEGTDKAKLDSLWEITAYVKYLTEPPENADNPANLPVEKLKTGSVTIEVPHESGTDDSFLPEANSILIGFDSVNKTLVPGTDDYKSIMNLIDKLITPDNGQIWSSLATHNRGNDNSNRYVDNMRDTGTFAELIYHENKSMVFDENPDGSMAFSRILIPLTGNYDECFALGTDENYSSDQMYAYSGDNTDLKSEISRICAENIPQETVSAETTTPAPAVT